MGWLGCAGGGGLETASGPGSEAARFREPLPRAFPVPHVPASNPFSSVKAELGRYLFYDTRLSGNGTYACASCHRQELAFTDGRSRALGSTGELHPRSAMSLANVAYNASFGWSDPEVRSLESQALVPMLNQTPVEMGAAGREEEIMERLRAQSLYGRLFREAFPEEEAPFTFAHVARALATFERSLVSGNSAYDRHVLDAEPGALSAAARRGMDLFFSERLACFRCHTGFNLSGPVTWHERPADRLLFHNTGLYNLGRGRYPDASPGLVEHTGKRRDRGRFRAPTLRNVALTAPYMHDGSVATLREVIEHYAGGGRNLAAGGEESRHRNPYQSRLVRSGELAVRDVDALVAFLEALTDHQFVEDPRFASPFP